MRRIVVACLIVAAATAWIASVATGARRHPRLNLTVTPAVGHPMTVFVVTFTAPQATTFGHPPIARYDVLAQQSCGLGAGDSVPPARKGARVRVGLQPAAAGPKPWCTGTVHGRLVELRGAGPAFRTIARFTFLVVKAPAADTTPPVFAGLQSAFACTPGPQTPGETTPFTLTWQAASDDRTPSSQIVYDVYMSTTPGGEDFSTPNWTSPPGATMFRTPGLPSHGTFYFVVRARDQAGNKDQNRVERRGIDPCY